MALFFTEWGIYFPTLILIFKVYYQKSARYLLQISLPTMGFNS